MSRKKRMKDLREAKDRRTKKLAVGGAVLLAAVLAFEMPKVLNHGGSEQLAAPAATTTAATGARPRPRPRRRARHGAAVTADDGEHEVAGLGPDCRSGRSRSSSPSATSPGKDPFVQQVSPDAVPPQGALTGRLRGRGRRGDTAGSAAVPPRPLRRRWPSGTSPARRSRRPAR